MKNINMGVLNKLFLEFPKVFWDNNVEVINYISESKGIWNESFNLANVLNKPILVMFSTSDLASQMENWPDHQIVNSAMNTLKKIYGPNIPNPIKYAITRWNSDPHTLGSYSYSAVGSSQPSNRKQISYPLLNRVFFAGEATSSLYPATVHGAYLSGLDTANSILKIS
jgi:monoamine oxidase